MIYDDLDEYWTKDGVYSSDVCTIENLIFSCPYFDENYEISYSPLTKRICLSHKEKDAKFYIKDGKYSFYFFQTSPHNNRFLYCQKIFLQIFFLVPLLFLHQNPYIKKHFLDVS